MLGEIIIKHHHILAQVAAELEDQEQKEDLEEMALAEQEEAIRFLDLQ
jgi:hypothetical protein